MRNAFLRVLHFFFGHCWEKEGYVQLGCHCGKVLGREDWG